MGSPHDAGMQSSTPPASRAGQPLMVGGGLLLGTLGIFLEQSGADPLTAVWFRCAFGALALLGWGFASGRAAEFRLRGRALAAALAAGLLMILNWGLFFAAIERTSIGVATVVFHVQPFWVMLLGAWWLREPVGRRQVGAVLLALLGLALAAGGPALWRSGAAAGGDYALGLAMCLGGSLSYAAVTLIARATRSVTPLALAGWQCLVGMAVLAWWPLVHGVPAAGAAWGWLAGLGLIHTGLVYVMLYAGIARLPAGRIAVLQFVYPAAAIVVDWAVYGHALDALQTGGVVLMAAALWSAGLTSAAPRPCRRA